MGRVYPDDIAIHIEQLDFTCLIQQLIHDQEHPDSTSDMSHATLPTWWSGPLLHMACTGQPVFVLILKQKNSCTMSGPHAMYTTNTYFCVAKLEYDYFLSQKPVKYSSFSYTNFSAQKYVVGGYQYIVCNPLTALCMSSSI